MITTDAGSVTRNLPLYETPGQFGGWEFLMVRNKGVEVKAYDQDGRPRWTIPFGQNPAGSQYRNFEPIWSVTSAKYVLAWGSLLLLKLDHEITVFDCSAATLQQPPEAFVEL